MKPFLLETAEFLLERHKENLSQFTMVFPNRRAVLFFQKYLAQAANTAIWSPACTTINELMYKFSGLQQADDITLIFELYQVYKKEKKTEETFDEFYYWGEMLLNDFDDMDKYLVDAASLFRNLLAVKEIEKEFQYLLPEQIEAIQSFWSSFDPDKNSKFQQDFISVWSILYNVYRNFNEKLKENAIAYEGMIYRNVAESCISKTISLAESDKYIFIGFNALTKCETVLFEHLKKTKHAEFYWDYDDFYISNSYHQAGFFMRKNLVNFPSPAQNFNRNNLTNKKNIRIIAAPSGMGQAKLVGKLLQQIQNNSEEDRMKTAIVLSDETLLLPVLYSIPDTYSDVNITMGYPVKVTAAYSFIEHLLNLQRNSKKNKKEEIYFYHKDVLKILNHQYISGIKEAQNIIDAIVEKNKISLSRDDFKNNEFLFKLFNHFEDSTAMISWLLDVLQTVYIRRNKTGKEPSIEQELIYKVYSSVLRIKDVVISKQTVVGVKILIKLILQIVKNIRIPFEGEPLRGLQVMGILETRALDFDSVILLSLNEGILPKSSSSPSFIPYNLRKGFELPTVEHLDSIYAYYFYRLLQRVDTIDLLYSTNPDDDKSGEMSRFLLQLKFDANFKVNEDVVAHSVSMAHSKEIVIPKDAHVLNILNSYTDIESEKPRYFSASALNSYIECSLKFYFSYIAGLKEQESVSEDIDAALFGSLLHETAEHLYNKQKLISIKYLDEIRNNSVLIDQTILDAFQKYFFKTEKEITIDDIEGKSILTFEMLKKYIRQLLEKDKKYSPITIIGLEKKINTQFPVLCNGGKKNINLYGIIDRIDQIAEGLRIVDYKTSFPDAGFTNIEALFERNNPKRNKAAFQTFYYSLLYKLDTGNNKTIPALYFIRDLFNEDFDFHLHDKNNKTFVTDFTKYEDEFTTNLNVLFEEIYNKDISFSQTDDAASCTYCPYAEICHRG